MDNDFTARPPSKHRWFRWTLILSVAYSSILLLPHRVPSLDASAPFAFYLLTFVVLGSVMALISLLSAAVIVVARIRGRRESEKRRLFFIVPFISIAVMGVFAGASELIGRGLPPGSFVLDFRSDAWKADGSNQGDVSIRQMMLGDVVGNVLPGHTRQEIELLFEPSLTTEYFQSTGRDVIYHLGTERNSFFRIDSEWLLIWLDRKGRFDRFEIASD